MHILATAVKQVAHRLGKPILALTHPSQLGHHTYHALNASAGGVQNIWAANGCLINAVLHLKIALLQKKKIRNSLRNVIKKTLAYQRKNVI